MENQSLGNTHYIHPKRQLLTCDQTSMTRISSSHLQGARFEQNKYIQSESPNPKSSAKVRSFTTNMHPTNNQSIKNSEFGNNTYPSSKSKIALLPKSSPNIPITLGNSTANSKHKPYSKISNIVGKNIGSISDSNSSLSTLVKINLIKADAKAGDDLKAGQGVDEGGVGTGEGVSDDGAYGGGLLGEELGTIRKVPEAEEVETLVELVF